MTIFSFDQILVKFASKVLLRMLGMFIALDLMKSILEADRSVSMWFWQDPIVALLSFDQILLKSLNLLQRYILEF